MPTAEICARRTDVSSQVTVNSDMLLLQAQQLTDVPQINPAVVQSLKSGVYMNIISGAFSQCALLQLMSWL